LPLIFIWQSPHLPVPKRNETSRRVHSAAKKGNLRASPGKSGAIARCRPGISRSPAHEISGKMPRVSAGPINVISLPAPSSGAVIPELDAKIASSLGFGSRLRD
jgi:hypothetical protein